MHDIRQIRDNPEAFDAALARRDLEPLAASLIALDEERRALTTQVQQGQSRRNEASKLIGQAMAQGDKDKAEALKAEVAELKIALPAKEEAEREQLAALQDKLAALPNLPAADVPDGEDEDANVEISRWGTPRSFDFAPQEHADFAPALGLDFETAAKMSCTGPSCISSTIRCNSRSVAASRRRDATRAARSPFVALARLGVVGMAQ